MAVTPIWCSFLDFFNALGEGELYLIPYHSVLEQLPSIECLIIALLLTSLVFCFFFLQFSTFPRPLPVIQILGTELTFLMKKKDFWRGMVCLNRESSFFWKAILKISKHALSPARAFDEMPKFFFLSILFSYLFYEL